MGFEPGTLRFLLQRLNPLGHSPQSLWLHSYSLISSTPAMVVLGQLMLPDFFLPNLINRVGLWIELYLLFNLGLCEIKKNDAIAIKYFSPVLTW